MGYVRHDAIVATVSDYYPKTIEDIEAFRASMPDEFAKYLVGPVVGVNGTYAYCFLPDGSKEGWEHSDTAEEYREAFGRIVMSFRHNDGSGTGDLIYVSFGGDFKHDFDESFRGMIRDLPMAVQP